MLTFGSVCSGIEAASVAWHPLGWKASWLAEVEKFPSAVLAYHYPETPNLGDMTAIAARILAGEIDAPDIFVGGTPCQAYSVAGARAGLADPRGQLTLAYVDLANAIDTARALRGKPPAVDVWENVPGVLSSHDNAFGCFLGGLAGESSELEPAPRPATGKSGRFWRWDKKTSQHIPSWPDSGCVYGPQRTVAWRVCDAQYFGVAQRRRRVFVVASAREGIDPAAILFEFEGLRRDTPPSREQGEGATGHFAAGAGGSRHNSHWNGGVHPPLSQSSQTRAGGIGGSNQEIFEQGGAGLVPTIAYANAGHFGGMKEVAISDPLRAKGGDTGNGGESLIACLAHGQGGAEIRTDGGAPCLTCNHEAPIVVHGTQDPCISVDTAFALGRNSGQENVLAFSCKDYGADVGELSPTLRAMGHGESHANAGGQVAVAYAFQPRIARNGRGDMGDLVSALTAQAGETGKGDAAPCVAICVTGEITHTLKAEGFDASEDGTGRGQPIVAAFAENSRAELRYEAGDGSIIGALSTGGGKAGQGTPVAQVGWLSAD